MILTLNLEPALFARVADVARLTGSDPPAVAVLALREFVRVAVVHGSQRFLGCGCPADIPQQYYCHGKHHRFGPASQVCIWCGVPDPERDATTPR